MGKADKNRSKQRLASMAPGKRTTYKPPPRWVCSEEEWKVALTDHDHLVVRQRIFRGKICDFAIIQFRRDHNDVTFAIVRVDCCHGTVHRHVLSREGEDLEREVIKEIPAIDGRDVVDSMFSGMYDRMMSDYDANVRGWLRYGSQNR